jgi:hypothetical protein
MKHILILCSHVYGPNEKIHIHRSVSQHWRTQFSRSGRKCNPNIIFTRMQDEVFHLNLAFTYMRSSLICIWGTGLNRSKPDHSELDHAEPNLGLHCQIMWHLHFSEILHSIVWYFFTNISGQSVGVSFKGQEMQKREHSMTEINWHNLLFWDFVHHLIT